MRLIVVREIDLVVPIFLLGFDCLSACLIDWFIGWLIGDWGRLIHFILFGWLLWFDWVLISFYIFDLVLFLFIWRFDRCTIVLIVLFACFALLVFFRMNASEFGLNLRSDWLLYKQSIFLGRIPELFLYAFLEELGIFILFIEKKMLCRSRSKIDIVITRHALKILISLLYQISWDWCLTDWKTARHTKRCTVKVYRPG